MGNYCSQCLLNTLNLHITLKLWNTAQLFHSKQWNAPVIKLSRGVCGLQMLWHVRTMFCTHWEPAQGWAAFQCLTTKLWVATKSQEKTFRKQQKPVTLINKSIKLDQTLELALQDSTYRIWISVCFLYSILVFYPCLKIPLQINNLDMN